MRQTATRIAHIRDYHEQTKHRMTGYARGPEMLDWDDQPNPFRSYDGAQLIELPLSAQKPDRSYASLWKDEPEGFQPSSLNIDNLSSLLELSLALSAWKQMGESRWSMRCNPSSGNLHPTEAYLVLLNVSGIPNGVYHYRADRHALELRCELDSVDADPSPTVMIGLSSVHWREAWKYGERSFRYCQHDVGHAIGALGYASATLGWSVNPVHVSDSDLATLIGLKKSGSEKAEQEHSDCLLLLCSGDSKLATGNELQSLIDQASKSEWMGTANVLNRRHFYQWDLVDQAADMATRQADELRLATAPELMKLPPALASSSEAPAQQLIRQRRSAQGFDATTPMTQDQLFEILDHLLPRENAPWHSLAEAPHIHLLLFIHRVEGLAPGLYVLPRTGTDGLNLLKGELKSDFLWKEVSSAPEHLPLYLLQEGKTQRFAVRLCCQQTIAGSSAFSLGMLAEFDRAMERGQWHYRSLHWEAGSIGQALYLEAEAAGFRGTGIGCFLDDEVHEFAGIQSTRLQTIYHFTVGTPLHDPRITTWPPYSHR